MKSMDRLVQRSLPGLLARNVTYRSVGAKIRSNGQVEFFKGHSRLFARPCTNVSGQASLIGVIYSRGLGETAFPAVSNSPGSDSIKNFPEIVNAAAARNRGGG